MTSVSVWGDSVVERGNRCFPHPKGVYERLRYRSLVKDKCKSLIMRFKSPGEKKKEKEKTVFSIICCLHLETGGNLARWELTDTLI